MLRGGKRRLQRVGGLVKLNLLTTSFIFLNPHERTSLDQLRTLVTIAELGRLPPPRACCTGRADRQPHVAELESRLVRRCSCASASAWCPRGSASRSSIAPAACSSMSMRA